MKSNYLRKFFMFDGLTLITLLVLGVVATLDAFWLFVGGWIFGVGSGAGYWSPPVLLDIPLRILIVLAVTFISTYLFRLRNGFERVRLSLVASVLGVCVVIIFLLHVFGVINIIPG